MNGILGYGDLVKNGEVVYHYIKITKINPHRYRFQDGYEWENKIYFTEPSIRNQKGIYLKPINGKLIGKKFTSGNFRATHGLEFEYKITLDMNQNNKIRYTVFSDLFGDSHNEESCEYIKF